jgi:hypothetical protein
MPTVLKRALALLVFLIIFNFIWSYLWYLTDASPNPAARVAVPKLSDLYKSYLLHTRQLADVNWHAGLVENGYERLDSKAPGFDWSWQRNWAYFPLQPYLSRPLTWLGLSPIFALLASSFLGVLALTTMCMGIVDRAQAFSDQAMRIALLVVCFVIPPLGLMTNFVVMAAAIFVAAYLLLRQILAQGLATPPILIISTAAVLIASGLSRVQGLIFSVSIVAAFILAALCATPARAKIRTIGIFVAAAVIPIFAIAILFQTVANDPLAFQKIQRAWGRVFSMPWKPVLEALRSGSVVNFGNGTEAPFTLIRLSLFAALTAVGMYYWLTSKGKNAARHLLIFDGCALVIGLALIAAPLMTSTLMSAHRYMACSAIIVAAALQLGWRPAWGFITLLLLLRMGELVLFSRGYLFLIW